MSKLLKPNKVLFVPPDIGTVVEIITAHFGGQEEDRAIVRGLIRGLLERAYLAGAENKWEIDTQVNSIISCAYCNQPAQVECQNCHRTFCQKHRNVIMYKDNQEAKVYCNDCLPLGAEN